MSNPRTPTDFASRPIRAASAPVVRTGSTRTSRPEPSRLMERSLLRLGFEGIRGERIGPEQIERELAAALWLARHPLEQRRAQLRQTRCERGTERAPEL